jgi:hypothetical protein
LRVRHGDPQSLSGGWRRAGSRGPE